MQNVYVPSSDEYLEVTTISLGLDPIVLSAMFLMDEHLPDRVIGSAEFQHLIHLLNRTARLQNDVRTYKVQLTRRQFAPNATMCHCRCFFYLPSSPLMQREMNVGKINSLTIHMMKNRDKSIQDVQKELLTMAFADVKEVVREVYSHQIGIHPAGIPPHCLHVVLDTAFCCCFFYQSDDEMEGLKTRKLGLLKSLLFDPIR